MKTTIRHAIPEDALDRKRLLSGVKKLPNDKSRGFYILGMVDRRVAGQFVIMFTWSDWWRAAFWWIQSVYVAPEFDGSSIFTLLFRYAEEKAIGMRPAAVCRA